MNVASIQDYLVGLVFVSFRLSYQNGCVIFTEIEFLVVFEFIQCKLVAIWRAVLQIPFHVMWKRVILLN